MTTSLPGRARELLDGQHLVVLTTLNPDGSPHSTPVWAMRDEDEIVMSTLTKRAKCRNLERDPRAAVVVQDPADPVCYFSVNGMVTLVPDPDKQVLHALSMKYLKMPYPIGEGSQNRRMTIRLKPGHVIAQYEAAR